MAAETDWLARYDGGLLLYCPTHAIRTDPCQADLSNEPWHFHLAFYPPLRAADKMKYLAGFETGGGNIINPGLPEHSAKELREVLPVHFLTINS